MCSVSVSSNQIVTARYYSVL